MDIKHSAKPSFSFPPSPLLILLSCCSSKLLHTALATAIKQGLITTPTSSSTNTNHASSSSGSGVINLTLVFKAVQMGCESSCDSAINTATTTSTANAGATTDVVTASASASAIASDNVSATITHGAWILLEALLGQDQSNNNHNNQNKTPVLDASFVVQSFLNHHGLSSPSSTSSSTISLASSEGNSREGHPKEHNMLDHTLDTRLLRILTLLAVHVEPSHARCVCDYLEVARASLQVIPCPSPCSPLPLLPPLLLFPSLQIFSTSTLLLY